MSKLYLDDERVTPEGWERASTAQEAITRLSQGGVTHLSLDHDLGDEEAVGNGYKVLLWLEGEAHEGHEVPEHIFVHSANAGAKPKMNAAILNIKKLVNRFDEQAEALNIQHPDDMGRSDWTRAISSILRQAYVNAREGINEKE